MQNFLLIGNGTFLPIAMMPTWMATAVSLIPSTLGIVLMRRVAIDGDSTACTLDRWQFAHFNSAFSRIFRIGLDCL